MGGMTESVVSFNATNLRLLCIFMHLYAYKTALFWHTFFQWLLQPLTPNTKPQANVVKIITQQRP